MEFRIAESFTTGLTRLTAEEQKAVKTTAFDLQVNPASPGMQFHRLDKSRDKHFWSIRVSSDIRIIVHKSESSLLLCYVDHHDRAYQWAERRKLETHPKTGAAQLVEVRERVEEITIPLYVTVEAPSAPEPKPALFAACTTEELLGFGVPPEWVEDVRKADEATLLVLADHLPAEASEALLELATGGTPKAAVPASKGADPFTHPDAQRRFRVLRNVEELEAAFANPWEKWILFLHPSQKELVDKEFSGPARVSGSAGTGKTIVALHRAVALARRHPDARVLLTTFSETLANALRSRLLRLLVSEPKLGERLEVHDLNAIGRRLYERNIDRTPVADSKTVAEALKSASAQVPGHKFSEHFLRTEWDQVVDAWQVHLWETYRDVKRLGRKTRLPEKQRLVLWSIFDLVRKDLKAQKRVTCPEMFARLSEQLAAGAKPPFDFAVVDESQDIQVSQLRYLAAMGKGRHDSLFFAGDLGQRIFQLPFSWKGLDVDIRGRSTTLQVNYRTSHQIRTYADRLLGPEVTDVDGIGERRKGTVSVFNGPTPDIQVFPSPQKEIEAISQWLKDRAAEGYKAHEIGVFVRSSGELEQAQEAVGSSGFKYRILDAHLDILNGHVSVGTMHMAKGLEFRAVAVMACDDEIAPLQARIETVTDDADLTEVYETERQLLYVACTRARDQQLVTSGGDASEFLGDLRG